MRCILVPVADRPECASALKTAFDLAEDLSANVLGLHVRPRRQEEKGSARSPRMTLTANSGWQDSIPDDQIRLDREAAARFFQTLVEEHDFTFSKSARYRESGGLGVWHEFVGRPEAAFAIAGPMSDMVLVSRPKTKKSRRAQSFLLSALLLSGRPALVLPQRYRRTLGKHVMIAWNQSREASAAVAAALPLLRRAESVSIVSAGPENRLGPKSRHLQQYLKYWNVESQCVSLAGEHPEQEVIEAYDELNGDLLVMGAYRRGHWRETIFGGMTDKVLNETPVPAFMLHT